MDIERANRQSGSWVKGNCLKRCSPCGNPLCADEAMRANQTAEYSPFNAKHAAEHALKTVSGCFSEELNGFTCPLGNNQNEVEAAIKALINGKK